MLFGFVVSLVLLEEVVDDAIHDVAEGDYESPIMDRAVADWILTVRSVPLTRVMTDLTSLGSFTVLTLVTIGVGFFLATHRAYRHLAQLIITSAGVVILVPSLKLYFGRERPDVEHHLVSVSDLSFPSGHSFGSAAMYCVFAMIAVAVLESRAQRAFIAIFSIAMIAFVASSRIYLGVHHTSDVLAGISGGFAWAFFVSLCFEFKDLMPKSSK